MILLSRLNGSLFALNCDLIETIESTPDTTIRLVNKNIYIVKEDMDEVMGKIIEYRKSANGIQSQILSYLEVDRNGRCNDET